MNARKKRNLLINPKFQITIITTFMIISFLACAILYFSIQLTFHSMLELAHAQGLTNDHVFFQFIAWQKDKINLSFVIVGMGVFIITTLVGLLISHRIAGPFHRFQTYLQENKMQANTQPLSFREGDFFQEIPALFNQFVREREQAVCAESVGSAKSNKKKL